jgi:hypothetical protein
MPSSGDGHRPSDGRALLGPLLTERQFARRAGLSRDSVRRHRCVPRVESPIGLGPAYPAFLLDTDGLRLDVAFITLLLRRRVGDLDACDWLVRPNPVIGGATPLHWIDAGLPLEGLMEALPTPQGPSSERTGTADVEAIREEWLRFRGDEQTPGWTIAWEQLARTSLATPHGV